VRAGGAWLAGADLQLLDAGGTEEFLTYYVANLHFFCYFEYTMKHGL
jgi:hypothetical protein